MRSLVASSCSIATLCIKVCACTAMNSWPATWDTSGTQYGMPCVLLSLQEPLHEYDDKMKDR